ncbi:MAG: porphobilinogen synthase, partial [Pirellulales bacterium]
MSTMDPKVPGFPTTRLRRLRSNPALRRLVREVDLSPGQLILPLFARTGRGVRQEIPSLPGHAQLTVDLIAEEAAEASRLGLGGVLLFGIPAAKDPLGSDSFHDDGVVQQAIRAVKKAAPDLLCITDVCFCEYTDHGHCGALAERDGKMDVDNDTTLQ